MPQQPISVLYVPFEVLQHITLDSVIPGILGIVPALSFGNEVDGSEAKEITSDSQFTIEVRVFLPAFHRSCSLLRRHPRKMSVFRR